MQIRYEELLANHDVKSLYRKAPVDRSEIDSLYQTESQEVARFLGVSGIQPCKVSYGIRGTIMGNLIMAKSALLFLVLSQKFLLYYTYGVNDLSDLLCFPILIVASIFVSYYLFSNMSAYSHKKESIILQKQPIGLLRYTIVHEFDHHVLYKCGIPLSPFTKKGKRLRIFHEGHATGVGRKFAIRYSKEFNDEMYLAEVMYNDLLYLQAIYKWICKKTKNKIDKKLITRIHTPKFIDRCNNLALKFSPESHAYGAVFFLLLERKYGPDIYRRVLHEPPSNFDLS